MRYVYLNSRRSVRATCDLLRSSDQWCGRPGPARPLGPALGPKSTIATTAGMTTRFSSSSTMSTPVCWPTDRYFEPFGRTPASCVTRHFPPDVSANILLLDAVDCRNVLFTVFCENLACTFAPFHSGVFYTSCSTGHQYVEASISLVQYSIPGHLVRARLTSFTPILLILCVPQRALLFCLL